MTAPGAAAFQGAPGHFGGRGVTRFSADLAEIVFGENVSAARVEYEGSLVARFKAWMDQAARGEIHMKSGSIDKTLIGELSAPNMLEIARMIEDRCPEVIENMPNLKGHLTTLQLANQLAQVFMPSNMAMLVLALQEEGGR